MINHHTSATKKFYYDKEEENGKIQYQHKNSMALYSINTKIGKLDIKWITSFKIQRNENLLYTYKMSFQLRSFLII